MAQARTNVRAATPITAPAIALRRSYHNLFMRTPIGWNFIQSVGVSVFASRTIRRTTTATGGN
jgi:hypothetical protein